MLRGERQASLWRLVLRANLVHGGEVTRRVHAAGFPELQLGWPRLLAHLDTEGTRLRSIAQKAGITPQAASQMIDDLQAGGFVERARDPADGRGVLIRFTPRGRQMLETAVEKMQEVEAEYAALLGQERYAQLKSALADLLARIDEHGALGV